MKINDRQLRPIWQIILLFPVALIYWPAKAFVDFVEEHI